MKEVITQFKAGVFVPNTPNDLDIARQEFRDNQLVRLKAYSVGAKKERSVTQLGLLHACFKLVSDNTENPMLNQPEKVKFACKVHTHFVDKDIVFVKPDNTVCFQYRSFSFATLDHMEACNIFERCFEYMSELLGVTKEKLIESAQEKMTNRYSRANF